MAGGTVMVVVVLWWVGGIAVALLGVILLPPRFVRIPSTPELADPWQPVPDEDNAWPALEAVCDRLIPPLTRAEFEQGWAEVRREQAERPRRSRAAGGTLISRMFACGQGPLRHDLDAVSKTKSFEVPSRDALFAVINDAASALERPHLVLPRPESDPYFSANEMRRAMALQALVRLWSVAGELALDAGDTADGLAILRRGITLADRMVLAGNSCVVSQLILSAWALAALANALGPRPGGAGGDPTVAWPPTGWTVEQQGLWRALLDDLLHSLANPQLDAAYHAAEGLGFAAPSWLSPGWQAHPKPPLRWLQNDELHTAWLRRRVTAAVVEESVLPHYLRRMDRVRAAARDSGWRRWYNHYGHWLVGTYYAQSAPTRLSLLDRYRHSRHRVALAIALKLFNERHARMPAVWEEVVADGLLADVPLDPFDGEPVRFDAAAGRLWFVGKRWGEADEGQRWNWLRSMPPEQRREMETPEGLQQRPHPENLDLAWLAEPQEQQREPVVTSADGSDWWLAFTKRVMGKEMAEKERQAAGLA